MKTKLNILALTLGIVCTQFGVAQTFKRVNVSGNVPLTQVSSGGASVWALASNGHPYVLKGKSFALANSISLSQIAVGGGNAFQADAVWALNSSGNVYRASKSGTTWVFSQVSGSLDGIAVGPGYQDSCHPYEVWGLDPSAHIFRYNFCGNNFDQEPGTLCDIKVGGGDVWGASCGPQTFQFNLSTGTFEETDGGLFTGFPALTVGPNGGVWAIDTATNTVCKWFDPGWGCYLPGQQVQAGGNGVWVLSGNTVYRLEGSTSYVQVPGVALVSISVGTGGGIWGINGSHQVFAFSTP